MSRLKHVQFEALCVSNHTARSEQKEHGFSARFGPDGAVLPSRVSPFPKLKRSKNEPVNISCNKQQGAKDERPLLPVVVAHFAIRRGTFCNVQRNT
ncbi:MAG TPA: hypothetical protein H9857_06080, partial [Candidatus Desulfovibrio intestinigallinarum]|nr:hypothetical protein [Candidatus Desulfovibrio intestinigallinarum]